MPRSAKENVSIMSLLYFELNKYYLWILNHYHSTFYQNNHLIEYIWPKKRLFVDLYKIWIQNIIVTSILTNSFWLISHRHRVLINTYLLELYGHRQYKILICESWYHEMTDFYSEIHTKFYNNYPQGLLTHTNTVC